jgi:4-carboxymuconolactone decarboxylase
MIRRGGMMRLELIVAGLAGAAMTAVVVVVGAAYVHRRAAERAGLPEVVIAGVRDERRPTNMTPDVAAVYDFCNELLTKKRVNDATLQAARKVLGSDRGIVDLVGTLGAYQLVAMMMVVDEFPLPPGVTSELKN